MATHTHIAKGHNLDVFDFFFHITRKQNTHSQVETHDGFVSHRDFLLDLAAFFLVSPH